MNCLIPIFSSLIGFGLLVIPFSIWVLKLWIQSSIEKGVQYRYDEKIKEIERRHSEELAAIESQLTQNNFRFSVVFEKAVSVIEETYKKLRAVMSATSECHAALMLGERNFQDKAEERLNKAVMDLAEFYSENEIYIRDETSEKINRFTDVNIRKMVDLMGRHYDAGNRESYTIERQKGEMEKFQKEIMEIIRVVKNDFQQVLGIKAKGSSERENEN